MRLAVAVPAMMFATLAFAQSGAPGFDGKWAGDWVHGPTPAETDRLVLNLAADANEQVSGSVNVDNAFNVPIDWGFIQDDLIVFQIRFPTEHGPFPLVFMGRASGGSIQFGISAHDLPSLPSDAANHMVSVFKFAAAKQP